ncbi:hypothetical protein BD413DRAFT_545217 [Trametes elegans]|nr:hypothetical protein BD413DRAFT_545217 [Trametes elegans]
MCTVVVLRQPARAPARSECAPGVREATRPARGHPIASRPLAAVLPSTRRAR